GGGEPVSRAPRAQRAGETHERDGALDEHERHDERERARVAESVRVPQPEERVAEEAATPGAEQRLACVVTGELERLRYALGGAHGAAMRSGTHTVTAAGCTPT